MKKHTNTWNHRLILHTWEYDEKLKLKMSDDISHSGTYLAIHEVHYEDAIPYACGKDPCHITGEDLLELTEYLEMIQSAFSKPILNMSDFEQGGKYYGD